MDALLATRARRIKCGEEKPSCVRCVRSSRVCEGYPARAPFTGSEEQTQCVVETTLESSLNNESSLLPNPHAGLSENLNSNPQHDEFAKLGVSLLASDSFGCFGTSGSLLEYLLPQLSRAIPSVNATAVALGAAYKLQAQNSANVELEALAASCYVAGLQLIQKDLNDQSYGLVPLIAACLFLAGAEVLFKRPRHSLLHLRGAYDMLRHRGAARSPCTSWSLEGNSPTALTSGAEQDNLELLFQALDLQTSTYALSYQPRLSCLRLPCSGPVIVDLTSSRINLINTMQSCFTWTASVFKLKYFPLLQTRDLLIEQGRHIAKLSIWLEQFNSSVMPLHKNSQNQSPKSFAESAHALRLRMMYLSTLVYVSSIFNPYEISHDIHASAFQQIVMDAEAVLSIRSAREDRPDRPLGNLRFSTGPGIIQPLYVVAEKYRESSWRRRAISCLCRAGLEGPWNGPREAAATLRLAQHEEAWLDHTSVPKFFQSSLLQQTPELANNFLPSKTSAEICETARLHGCVLPPNSSPRNANTFKVVFYRCRDVERMLTCACNRGAYEDLFNNKAHCDVWEETLEY